MDTSVRSTAVDVSALRANLEQIAYKLWWQTDETVQRIFATIDEYLWADVNHNPVRFLRHVDGKVVDAALESLQLRADIDSLTQRIDDFTRNPITWAALHAPPLHQRVVVYLSAEFGLHEGFSNYSGGLGILAGDHLKSASDLGLPIVGVTLLYHEGYFTQWVDREGWQHDVYQRINAEELPITRCHRPNGTPLTVAVATGEGEIHAEVYEAAVGRAKLLLLDLDAEQPSEIGRQMISRLYGGDQRNRICQELMLGVGGLRAVRALGYTIGAIHMNEGHSAFAVLEDIRHRMHEAWCGFAEAAAQTAMATVFTTHTPVLAGHDRFEPAQLLRLLGPMREELGLPPERLLGLGRIDPGSASETFCMTVLAMRIAMHINGVSAIHGKVSRQNWSSLWHTDSPNAVPIGHITNGVHIPTWVAPDVNQLFRSYLSPDWTIKLGFPDLWTRVEGIPDEAVWQVRSALRSRLLAFCRQRVTWQEVRQGVKSVQPVDLRDDVLTIGFARRFAPYKRADLLLRDTPRLLKLLQDSERPMQIIFAGKAHPQDDHGRWILREIVCFARSPECAGRVVFLEDYDMAVARYLVQGVDVWLNTPRPPLEACGTSGMKVAMNGGLNFSVRDGWWAEAYDGLNGFAIGGGSTLADAEVQDELDSESLYRTLETEIIPCFYKRPNGLPHEWIARIKRGWWTIGWRFNSDSMVRHYVETAYMPAAGGDSLERREPRRTRDWERIAF
jgi:starch phosphorylase